MIQARVLAIVAAVIWGLAWTCAPLRGEDKPPAPAAPAAVSYFKDIRPIFQAHCQGCHQPAKAMGELRDDRLRRPGQRGRKRAAGRSCRASRTRATCSTQITPDDGKAEMPKDKPPLTRRPDQEDSPVDRRRRQRRHARCRSGP